VAPALPLKWSIRERFLGHEYFLDQENSAWKLTALGSSITIDEMVAAWIANNPRGIDDPQVIRAPRPVWHRTWWWP
jgi:hypothetical protein